MRYDFRSAAAGKTPLEIVLTAAVALAALASLVSISLVQSFLAVAAAVWVVLLVRGERRFEVPAFFWPLAVYAGLSLVSSAFSVNPALSFKDSRELTLLLFIPITMAALRKKGDVEIALGALLVSGFLNGFYALGYWIARAAPGERVEGFMAHYMTQAGLLALFGAFALAAAVFGRGRIRIVWGAAFVLASAALFLTYTRSAWAGMAVAAVIVVLLWKPKALVLVPVLAGLLFLAAPKPMKDRVLGVFTSRNISNTARVEYAKAGIAIARDYLPFGTGPDTVDMVFQNPKYGLDEFAKHNVHLHSNVIQLAAERGPFALAAWLAFIASAFIGLGRRTSKKGGRTRTEAAGAFAALAGFFVAGFFEYNFGDSEVATLLFFLLTVPFAAARIEERPSSDRRAS
jgi:O-antigen ligase